MSSSTAYGSSSGQSDLSKTSFGELTVASLKAEVQVSASYNQSGKMREVTVGAGSTGFANGEFYASSGSGSSDVGSIFSDRQVMYKPGQGALIRYTARFGTPASGNRQSAGPSTAGDTLAFGYDGTDFGIFYAHHGLVIIQELQVTGAAGGGENATITINGTGYTVPLTAGTVQHNANEIADSLNAQAANYNFTQNEDTVVCRSVFAAPGGSFAFSSGTATGSWTAIETGAAVTRVHIPQSSWNINTMVGLDPSMGNIYQIQFQCLGYGAILFSVEGASSGEFINVHRIQYANSNTQPSLGVPTFRIAWTSTNAGSTTSVKLYGASGAGYIEGNVYRTQESRALSGSKVSVGTTATNILTVRCREVFGTKVNLGRLIPLNVTASTVGNKGAILDIVQDATLGGTPDYSYIDKTTSIAEFDTSGTTVTGGTLVASVVVPALGAENIDLSDFNELILPGNTMTISMRVPSASSADMSVALIWDEDL